MDAGHAASVSNRPSVRRKSSALLSTLSRSSSASAATATLPSSSSSAVSLGDGSDSYVSSDALIPPVPPVPHSSTECKSLVQKRMTTWSYLRRAHEGRVHWFNTILLPREDLDAAFTAGKIGGSYGMLMVPLRVPSDVHVGRLGLRDSPFWACRYRRFSIFITFPIFFEPSSRSFKSLTGWRMINLKPRTVSRQVTSSTEADLPL